MGSGYFSHSMDLYLTSYLSHNLASSAYPPDRQYGFSTVLIFCEWEDPAQDAVFHNAVKQSAERIRAIATSEGHDVGPKSPGTAAYDTLLEDMYGGNVPRLMAFKASVDPTNVMGLAGGFKF